MSSIQNTNGSLSQECRTLYCVSTYYHALISCVKQLTNKQRADILCTDYIPEGAELQRRLAESGLFENAYFISDVTEYTPRDRLDFILHFHRKNAAQIECSFPQGFWMENYSQINVSHDDT